MKLSKFLAQAAEVFQKRSLRRPWRANILVTYFHILYETCFVYSILHGARLDQIRFTSHFEGNAALGVLGGAWLAWLDSICGAIKTGIFEQFSGLSCGRRRALLGCGIFTLCSCAHTSDALRT